jgi:hypothetical protein
MRKNLFLYLTLACFFGLIAIFVVDGYLGVYDTLYVTSGEYEEEIEADFWLRQDWTWSTGVNWGENVFLQYEVANHLFSGYSADIAASVWHGQEKEIDLGAYPVSIDPFGKAEVEWLVDTTELLPNPPEQNYQYSIIIKRGEIERKIIIDISAVSYPPKTEIVPAR